MRIQASTKPARMIGRKLLLLFIRNFFFSFPYQSTSFNHTITWLSRRVESYLIRISISMRVLERRDIWGTVLGIRRGGGE